MFSRGNKDDPSINSNTTGKSSKKRKKKRGRSKRRNRADSDDGSIGNFPLSHGNGSTKPFYTQDDHTNARFGKVLGEKKFSSMFKRKHRSASPVQRVLASVSSKVLSSPMSAVARNVSFCPTESNDLRLSSNNINPEYANTDIPNMDMNGGGSNNAFTSAVPYANSYSRPQQGQQQQSLDYEEPEIRRGGQSLTEDTRKVRVRPYRCFDGPCYMTDGEIYKDMMKPSTNFVFLKSHHPPTTAKKFESHTVSDRVRKLYGTREDGRIGSLRAEVLGCVGLARTKPFSAVYLVSGDNAFCTDVLNNFRSPMWPSISTRAAVFPVHHAYAQLYCGVFDVRARKGKENDVFCGRVVIDLATLRPNTEYDVTFPIRASSFIYDRRPRGVVRIRFSIHYFSERAAVLSYFKKPKWETNSPAKQIKQPTIPCAEPKTFRNVAVTLHGQDFPGKYTRASFRATIREFNLYQQNLRFMAKMIVLDAIFYENIFVSSYLFISCMHCTYSISIKMIPVYFYGLVLLLFLINYAHTILDRETHLGYKPLTIREVSRALLFDGGAGKDSNLGPLRVTKRAKRTSFQTKVTEQSYYDKVFGIASSKSKDGQIGESREIELRDHREFPFSEKNEYKKFSVEDAIAPSSNKTQNKNVNNQRMAGRLSMYFVANDDTTPNQPIASGDEGGDDPSDSSEESDDRTIGTTGDGLLGDDDWMESSSDEQDSEDENDGNKKRIGITVKKSILIGPAQNADVSTSKRVPPHVHLKKIENNLHKFSKKVSVEKIMTQPYTNSSSLEALTKQQPESSDILSMKKVYWDEFDRALGLVSRTSNPVLRVTSTFLGPLMRMIRILIYVVRIVFNISTWRDPYASFWVFIYLTGFIIFLYIFPWRPFFFLSTILCFGPQNILVRKHLEKKAVKKAAEENRKKEAEENELGYASNQNQVASSDLNEYGGSQYKMPEQNEYGGGFVNSFGGADNVKPKKVKSRFWNRMKSMSKIDSGAGSDTETIGGKDSSLAQNMNQQVPNQLRRPAFSTQHNARTLKKGLMPREVVVPYSKFRKERFYDWPPDPTVSRATPVPLSDRQEKELRKHQNIGAMATVVEPQQTTVVPQQLIGVPNAQSNGQFSGVDNIPTNVVDLGGAVPQGHNLLNYNDASLDQNLGYGPLGYDVPDDQNVGSSYDEDYGIVGGEIQFHDENSGAFTETIPGGNSNISNSLRQRSQGQRYG